MNGVIPAPVSTESRYLDRSETVTTCENMPAYSPSIHSGVSWSMIVVSSTGVRNGARHDGPGCDAPPSSHSTTMGRCDQSSTIGRGEARSHLRALAWGSTKAMPAICGVALSAPRMNASSARGSSSFSLPIRSWSSTHRACRTTGRSCDSILRSSALTSVSERDAMSRRVFSVALDSPRDRETPTASAISAPEPTTAMAVIGKR